MAIDAVAFSSWSLFKSLGGIIRICRSRNHALSRGCSAVRVEWSGKGWSGCKALLSFYDAMFVCICVGCWLASERETAATRLGRFSRVGFSRRARIGGSRAEKLRLKVHAGDEDRGRE